MLIIIEGSLFFFAILIPLQFLSAITADISDGITLFFDALIIASRFDPLPDINITNPFLQISYNNLLNTINFTSL